MNRMTYEVIFENGTSEIAEIDEWDNDVKFSKNICKHFIKDAMWFFRMYGTVKTVNCYVENREYDSIRFGKNIAISIDRMDDFYMVFMKNPGTYDYQMTRSFLIKE